MSLYPSDYPLIEDWDAYSALLLPDIAANGKGADFFRLLVDPLRAIDDEVALIYAGLVQLEDAAGAVLDLAGDQVNEPRQGLPDQLYRRIIAGRRVADAGGVTRPKVFAGWAALTGSADAVMNEPGVSSVELKAPVSFQPNDAWASRGGAVVRALMGAGYEATALVTTSTTAVFGELSTPFGTATFAHQLRVLGAS